MYKFTSCQPLLVCVRQAGFRANAAAVSVAAGGPFSDEAESRRSYHSSMGHPYQINYDRLRDGGQDVNKVISGNVKNVVGWRGGAERGFLSVYSDCIHVIRTEGGKFLSQDLTSKYMKVFTHNLSSEVLGQRYGILVPITYRQINPKATKDEMRLAHTLGWCVELVRAGSIVADNVCKRAPLSPKGSGNSTAEEQLQHPEPTANDALTLDAGVFVLLKQTFKDSNSAAYPHLLETVLEAQQSGIMSRMQHMNLSQSNGNGQSKLSGFDIQTYKQLIRTSVTDVNLCLPVSLALHLANLTDERIHNTAHNILHSIGYYFQVTRDYTNCYVDAHGSDIRDGRITWLIILARQRANPAQLTTLEESYGRQDSADAEEEVKKIYKDLNLKKMITRHMNETREDIYKQIQQISKLDEVGLTQDFFFKMLENMSAYQQIS